MLLAVALLAELDRARRSDARGVSLADLSQSLRVDPLQAEPIVDALVELDWLARLDEPGSARYVLLCDPAQTPAAPLLSLMLLEPLLPLRGFRERVGFDRLTLAELLQVEPPAQCAAESPGMPLRCAPCCTRSLPSRLVAHIMLVGSPQQLQRLRIGRRERMPMLTPTPPPDTSALTRRTASSMCSASVRAPACPRTEASTRNSSPPKRPTASSARTLDCSARATLMRRRRLRGGRAGRSPT